ncbi:GNAT family N-acetyltransferase [Fructobacillus americanaquae]|uniref:N-acetyltransferase family protein n=1 Tax=Fructobacillus americanaquae TaxID=2940302 RepID=A0ABY5BZZ7_9LACO|nr:GNAT family N-acetyltransferase [Fructobacillus americanaquae]USS91917.1 N-acetyltransferase family protein [Fructobacillus americanaquae]
MATDQIIFRPATAADAAELLAIYSPYIRETAITFEYEVPTVAEFQARIEKTLKTHPYIVAVLDDVILGYAYTSPMGSRQAYAWSVETSIYIRQDERHHGLGKRLYKMIEQISRDQNIINVNACIAVPKIDDEHLTTNSRDFHEHLGYRYVGAFDRIGYKFDTWYDLVWMQKAVVDYPAEPKPVVSFADLLKEGYQLTE